MTTKRWIKKNAASLSGRLVAVSGSTGGLGRELCKHIATLGGSLVLIDRNEHRASKFVEELKSEFPDLSVISLIADMSDIESVKDVADSLCKMPIDYLILNAGAYNVPRYTTDLGFDNVFQINFISPYYLARRLLPGIKQRGGKIIAVGSIAHNYSKIDELDVDFSTRKRASLVYGNAKRYLTYSLFALDGDNIVVTHPGISFTGITNHYPKLIYAIIKNPMKIIFMKPKRASLSILAGLFLECGSGEWIGPSIFDIWGLPKKKKLETATIDEKNKIAKTAEEIYNKTNKK